MKMSNLTDTQTLLLSHAARAARGAFYPLPDTLRPGGGIAKALKALVRQGLAEEREASEQIDVGREDGDLRFGLFVTANGLAAIGIQPATNEEPNPSSANTSAASRSTKAAAVLALLQRDQGATTPELIEAAGWLPHTTRAALTGLRKKGHALEKSKRDGAACYRIIPA